MCNTKVLVDSIICDLERSFTNLNDFSKKNIINNVNNVININIDKISVDNCEVNKYKEEIIKYMDNIVL